MKLFRMMVGWASETRGLLPVTPLLIVVGRFQTNGGAFLIVINPLQVSAFGNIDDFDTAFWKEGFH